MSQAPSPICGQELRRAVRHLDAGGVIAYPTEAVFGLGCDPDNRAAVRKILELKDRPADKGLILIAAEFGQLRPYLDLSGLANLHKVLQTWPGPVTWLIKARATVPFWIRGAHETIAVRVTGHPIASQLCRGFGKALISTSANPGGAAPARSALKTRLYFGHEDILIVKGEVGPERKPSAIFDAHTFARIR